MKLGSGMIDLARLHQSGIPVGIGTDGCSSSNDLDMWQAMRMAAHVQAMTSSPANVDAKRIFSAATIEAAKTLGMEERIGSIEVGKQADLIAIDLKKPHLSPIHDIFALLVFAAGRGDVTDVWVDGERVIQAGSSVRVKVDELLSRVHSRVKALEGLR